MYLYYYMHLLFLSFWLKIQVTYGITLRLQLAVTSQKPLRIYY